MTIRNHIALIGNPNAGKTTLFNALTGARQKVGNWPGVTIDKKYGQLLLADQEVEVVDLPGTYNLSTATTNNSIDEQIAIDYMLSNEADLVVNVVDSTNLERNLFLTSQLTELGIPVVIALNMTDAAKRKGLVIDCEKLATLLGCLVVPISASKRQGIDTLKSTINKALSDQTSQKPCLRYPRLIEESITTLQQDFAKSHSAAQARYLALHLLDDDVYAQRQANAAIHAKADKLRQQIEAELDDDTDIIIADARYTFINEVISATLQQSVNTRLSVTRIIDSIVLNRFLGIPIFLFVMYCMFLFAINVGGAFQDFFDIGSNTIFVYGLAHLLTELHFPVWLVALLSEGVGKGINTTITFIPVIGGMFLFLSFLEGSGYMTRAAFVVDRLMRAIGLPGKSFVPMIVGFGCNVPAIMGARTLDNQRDRILTILMSPFMSCGARLAIFAVFTAAFFPKGGQNVVFVLYLTGIFMAILTGLILRKTLLKGKPSPLVLEMPAYRLPTARALTTQTWQRLKKFLYKAGKFIIPICILIGTLNAFTLDGQLNTADSSQNSILSAAAKEITPLFAPMGIKQDNWPATVGLLTGTLAKEVVVGTLNTLYTQTGHLSIQKQQFHFWAGLKAAAVSVPENLASLGDSLGNPVLAGAPIQSVNHGVFGVMYLAFGGQAAAFAYLLFILLYMPCVSAMAVMLRELNRRWTIFSIAWTTGLAYGTATFAYQALTFAEHPISASIWMSGIAASFFTTILTMRHLASQQAKKSSSRNNSKQPVGESS